MTALFIYYYFLFRLKNYKKNIRRRKNKIKWTGQALIITFLRYMKPNKKYIVYIYICFKYNYG